MGRYVAAGMRSTTAGDPPICSAIAHCDKASSDEGAHRHRGAPRRARGGRVRDLSLQAGDERRLYMPTAGTGRDEMRKALTILFAAMLSVSCGVVRPRTPSAASPVFKVHTVTLPGASSNGVPLDYLAYDRAHHRVWVPAGDTGTVAVVDVRDDHVAIVPGFATAEIERHGTKRIVGPSSAAVANGVVYVGNRGDSSVCAIDAASLRVGPCVKLASMPDGIAYVSSKREVWVTTPRDK